MVQAPVCYGIDCDCDWSNGNLPRHDTDDTNRSFDDTRTIHWMAKMVASNANRPSVIMAAHRNDGSSSYRNTIRFGNDCYPQLWDRRRQPLPTQHCRSGTGNWLLRFAHSWLRGLETERPRHGPGGQSREARVRCATRIPLQTLLRNLAKRENSRPLAQTC